MIVFAWVSRNSGKVRILIPVLCLLLVAISYRGKRGDDVSRTRKELYLGKFQPYINLREDTYSSRLADDRDQQDPPNKEAYPLDLDDDIPFSKLLEDYSRQIQVLKKGRYWRKTSPKLTCDQEKDPEAACIDTNCNASISYDMRDNLRGVLSSMDGYDRGTLRDITRRLRNKHTHKKVVFVTAGSSDHFYRSQALIHNLHTEVFPLLNNYSFIFYDIGLLPTQRQQLRDLCRCEVRTFPISALPPGLRALRCYSWKPLIVHALLPTADSVVWMDASVRFQNSSLLQLLTDLQEKRMNLNWAEYPIGQHTTSDMMDYFQESSCSFSHIPEVAASLILFANDRFIREAIVKPWVACALTSRCICPNNHESYFGCRGLGLRKTRRYNKCHKFDQSALGIILVKLFRGHEVSLQMKQDSVLLWPGQGLKYFDNIEYLQRQTKINSH